MNMDSQDFQEDASWTENFINNVQSRQAIYDASMAEHADRNFVSGLWEEISEKMVPTWHNMSPMEKNEKVKELQNKWKNLKTCFRRELSKQKNVKSGQAATKRRKYVYFDQLSFLLSSMEDRPTVSNCEIEEFDENLEVFLTEEQNTPEITTQIQPTGSKKKKTTYEQDLLEILREKKDENLDEDKSFLLSLLPSFKKLNDSEKFDVKIEFLRILKRKGQNKESFKKKESHKRYHSYSKNDSDSESN
ncbi:uncharacterized protein LOC129942376 isoform X2 [Eupeodes corollae]|uniref:uncharacterized protein LOC129942376 isoform X2 n=1 Tax=Eupeodes corollae TaxID=290404 RepID=UPI0024914813|nr:uncharacterized protein LOC129942376 isoform X2 [Eupeodes corollae]